MSAQWFEAIGAAFGYKFESEGVRRAFYAEIKDTTGATNDEICAAVKWASNNGVTPTSQYGRVTTSDVQSWIVKMRASEKRKAETGDYRSNWIKNMKAALAKGYLDDQTMRDEAVFVVSDGETVEDLVAEVLG